jgi:hypothetical protein
MAILVGSAQKQDHLTLVSNLVHVETKRMISAMKSGWRSSLGRCGSYSKNPYITLAHHFAYRYLMTEVMIHLVCCWIIFLTMTVVDQI